MSTAGDATPGGFTASRQRLDTVLTFLDGADAAVLSHAQLEDRLDVEGRALLRQLFQDHLVLRSMREPRVDVAAADGVRRSRVETGHARELATIFGHVQVARRAYRTPGQPNLSTRYPAPPTINIRGLKPRAAA